MITSDGVIRYCESVFLARPVYIWGADMQVITKEFLEKLILRFGEKNYTKIDLDLCEGKYGADCSGMLTPISGTDSTANGYYQRCTEKGRAKNAPKDKVCLLFREQSGKIVHVAVLDGRIQTIYEMWDGCEKRAFNSSEWTYYGIPSWIEQTKNDYILLTKPTKVYMSSSDALADRGAVGTYPEGKYFVYKRANGCVNITKNKGVAGGWIVESEA